LEAGTVKPEMWMPASSLWTGLFNSHNDAAWRLGGKPFVRSPQVVAIWEPLARKLGWPDKPVSWSDLLTLGRTDAEYRYGHTNPDFSTSGLNAMIAEYATVAGHTPGGLTGAEVSSPQVMDGVRLQESHIVHYGDTADAFLDQMARYRTNYASWVITQETSLVGFAIKHPSLRPRLVAIYPRDGTYLADYPLVVVPAAAPWVSPLQHAAATRFSEWLRSHVTTADAAAEGYRAGDLNSPAVPPIDAAHGANPDPPALLPLPAPSVVSEIQRSWPVVRKPADVGLVVDRTCLLPDGGRQIQSGVATLLDGFSSRDRVGLWAAGSTAANPVAPALLGSSHTKLNAAVEALEPAPAGAVFDAIAAATDSIAALPGSGRNRGVIVMTDGRSDVSDTSLEQLVARLEQAGGPDRVRVFTVACSPNPDMQVLRRVAYASQGETFPWNLDDIGKVYRSLSAYY
jgi:Ca-activated chloride channel family protein